MKKFSAYIRIVRPEQWIKNILVFVPVFFASEIFILEEFAATSLVCVVFVLTSSAMYVLNDIYDRDQDRLHPVKSIKRPLASGALGLHEAYRVLTFLFVLIGIAFFLSKNILPALPYVIAYIILNIAYSRVLKNIPVVEIVTVSIFYILRVFTGGAVIGVELSHWIILCLFFVTLLIVSAKRLSEIKHEHKRKAVREYTEDFLKGVVSLCASLSILSYALYTILASPEGTQGALMYSIVFVSIAVLRFVMIAYDKDAEFPERKLITDPITLGAFFLWLVSIFYAFYIV